MRHLARMVRAWKDTNGVVMGGLLIDTLVHRFFSTTTEYDDKGTVWFDLMVRDFFELLVNEPDKDYYLALASNQRVTVKKRFQPKARKAYNRRLDAIADEGKASANKKWREVFGTAVPLDEDRSARAFNDTADSFLSRSENLDDERAYVVLPCRRQLLRALRRAGRPGRAAGDRGRA